MMKLNKYVCYPGKHIFQLHGKTIEIPALKRNPSQINWKVRVSDLRYTLPYPDNHDINKGGGISFDLFTNHIDSVMWGWRYWEQGDVVQFFNDCHVDGVQVDGIGQLPLVRPNDPEVCLEVPHDSNAVVSISLKVNSINKSYGMSFTIDGSSYAQYTEVPFTHDKCLARTIGAWFGGNNVASRRLEMYIGRSIAK